VLDLKKELMKQFECDNCGPMNEYCGCMIEKCKSGGIKFLQKVLLQSFRDEFCIKDLKKFYTPATPGTVLKKPINGDVLLTPEKQTLYHSGLGKAMHMMQYSRPDTYNSACDLGRHMTSATQVHMDAMLRLMKYADDTSDRGLVLNSTQSGMEVKTMRLSSVVEVIPPMQKAHRRERASPVTEYYWKEHLA
jgi:hypothetical protein